MKAVISMFITLLILTSCSSAKGAHLSRSKVQEGIKESEEWILVIEDITNFFSDGSMNYKIAKHMITALERMQTILLMTMELEADVGNGYGEITAKQTTEDIEGKLVIETGLIRPDGFPYALSASFSFDGDYCVMSYKLFDSKSGTLQELKQVEIGQIDRSMLAMYIHYNTNMETTDRAALLIEDGVAKEPIYMVTIGKQMRFRLNIKEWSNGKKIDEWDNSLLYSAKE